MKQIKKKVYVYDYGLTKQYTLRMVNGKIREISIPGSHYTIKLKSMVSIRNVVVRHFVGKVPGILRILNTSRRNDDFEDGEMVGTVDEIVMQGEGTSLHPCRIMIMLKERSGFFIPQDLEPF